MRLIELDSVDLINEDQATIRALTRSIELVSMDLTNEPLTRSIDHLFLDLEGEGLIKGILLK